MEANKLSLLAHCFLYIYNKALSKITKKSTKLQCSLNLLDDLWLADGSWCWWRLVFAFPFLTLITTLLNTTVNSLLQIKRIKLNLTSLQQSLNQLAIIEKWPLQGTRVVTLWHMQLHTEDNAYLANKLLGTGHKLAEQSLLLVDFETVWCVTVLGGLHTSALSRAALKLIGIFPCYTCTRYSFLMGFNKLWMCLFLHAWGVTLSKGISQTLPLSNAYFGLFISIQRKSLEQLWIFFRSLF